MLRAIPKHKGTEHLQADIKSRIKELSEELAGPKKGGGRGRGLARGAIRIAPRGRGAVSCLVGPPNAGKSTLPRHSRGRTARSDRFPTPRKPRCPGMLPYEDIAFQLVDPPPLSPEHIEPGTTGVVQATDAAWLVVDISDPGCTEQAVFIRDALARRKIVLDERWPAPPEDDVFTARLPTLLVATRATSIPIRTRSRSWRSPPGCATRRSPFPRPRAGPREAGAVRVRVARRGARYSKIPAGSTTRAAVRGAHGSRVLDVARLVHQDVAATLKYARIWGSGDSTVSRSDPSRIADGDVLELHAR